MTAGDCVRSGRKTARSIASESTSTTATQSAIPTADRPAALGREREREPARHDQLPVGEVDQAQDAEDEADADGHEREDRPQPDGGVIRGAEANADVGGEARAGMEVIVEVGEQHLAIELEVGDRHTGAV